MKPISSTPSFDFDNWAALARKNPQAFEIKRKKTIDQAISLAPPRRQARLRCLQWQLDQIRTTARTPLAASLRMQRMLWEKLAGESGLLACLQGSAGPKSLHCNTATILPFRD